MTELDNEMIEAIKTHNFASLEKVLKEGANPNVVFDYFDYYIFAISSITDGLCNELDSDNLLVKTEAENLAIRMADLLIRYGADLNTGRLFEGEIVYPIVECAEEIKNERIFAYLLEAGMKDSLNDEKCVEEINSFICDRSYLWNEYPDDMQVKEDTPILNNLCLLMRAYNSKIYTILDL